MTSVGKINENVSTSLNNIVNKENITVIWDSTNKEVIHVLTDDFKLIRDIKAFFIKFNHSFATGSSSLSGKAAINEIRASVLESDSIEISSYHFDESSQYSVEIKRLHDKYDNLLLKYKVKQSFGKVFPELVNHREDQQKIDQLTGVVNNFKKLKKINDLARFNHTLNPHDLNELLQISEKISGDSGDNQLKDFAHNLDEDFGINHLDLLLNYEPGKKIDSTSLKQLITLCKEHNCPKLLHSCFDSLAGVIKDDSEKMEMLELMAKEAPEQFKAAMQIPNTHGKTTIQDAASNKNFNILKLIAEHAPLAFKEGMETKEGKAFVFLAIEEEDLELVSFIAENAPDVLAMQDREGKTPVHWAAKDNNKGITQLIADKAPKQFEKSMAIRDNQRKTPIHLAAKNNNTEMMQLIADKAPKQFKDAMAVRDNKDKRTPFHWAAQKGNVDMIGLLTKEATVEQFKTAMAKEDKAGSTPIHLAAQNKTTQVMELIVENMTNDQFTAAMAIKDKEGRTPIHLAAENNDDAMLSLIMSKMPLQDFKDAMKVLDKAGRTPIHLAAAKPMKLIAKNASDEFRKAIDMQDRKGKTPVHWAAENKKTEAMSVMADFKEEFKSALSIKDKIENRTPIHWAAKSNSRKMIQLIADKAPTEFIDAIAMQDRKGMTPVHFAAKENNSTLVNLMAEKGSEGGEFKNAIGIKDREGNTPVHYAAEECNERIMKISYKFARNEFKEALLITNKNGSTPLHSAVKHTNDDVLNFLLNKAPKQSNAGMSMQDENGMTPVHLILNWENFNLMTRTIDSIAAGKTNKGFSNAMLKENNNGMTPLHLAVIQRYDGVVKNMHKQAPDNFKAALLIKDKNGRTPFFIEADRKALNGEMLKLMADCQPAALLSSRMEKNGSELSILDLVKGKRPHHYKELTALYKNKPEFEIFKGANKERLKRKATGHIFHLEGKKPLLKEKVVVKEVRLEGHFTEQWLHLMSKDNQQFKNSPSCSLSEKETNQVDLVIQTLDYSANASSFTTAEKLDRINKGLPTIINTGFVGHAVTVLIWGDQFILCNRGSGTRRPVEVYNFNPQKLDTTLLEAMDNVRGSTKEEYKKLFFETLNEKLDFIDNPLFDNFIDRNELPYQTVGNCSMESPVTSEYMMDLMSSIRGVQKDGRLSEAPIDETIVAERGKEGIKLFNSKHTFRQLSVMQRLIKPSSFEYDHELIMQGFKQLYSIPLDETGQQTLKKITDTYISSLDGEEKTNFKTSLISWSAILEEDKEYLF
ncbi:MAG: ankyrin repeat domain-containing protein [Candidatus Protochlamydia sp.]|nr:ankyrin repeat domain-containing protein [Candidatus Protochlamydia sp.]